MVKSRCFGLANWTMALACIFPAKIGKIGKILSHFYLAPDLEQWTLFFIMK
jgi:hypothetical protein